MCLSIGYARWSEIVQEMKCGAIEERSCIIHKRSDYCKGPGDIAKLEGFVNHISSVRFTFASDVARVISVIIAKGNLLTYRQNVFCLAKQTEQQWSGRKTNGWTRKKQQTIKNQENMQRNAME